MMTAKLHYETFQGVECNGYAKIYHVNGSIKYAGMWVDGVAHGCGLHYWDNNQVFFTGTFEHGRRCGRGRMYREDGSILFDGIWRDGLQDGQGRAFDADGNLTYNGEWVRGRKHGIGCAYDHSHVAHRGEWYEDLPVMQSPASKGTPPVDCGTEVVKKQRHAQC